MTTLLKTTTPMTYMGGRYYESEERRHILELDDDVLEDLGNPPVVTVTIEPGDKLKSAEGVASL